MGDQNAIGGTGKKKAKVLMLASVASMIGQFNLPNIRLLQAMGYEVHAACNFKQGNTCKERQIQILKGQLHRMQVVLHQWDCPRNIFPIKKCLAAYRQLRGLTRRCQYDLIHCHSPVGGALARAAAHAGKIKVIYTAHGFHFYKGAPVKNWLLYYPAELLLSYWTDVLVTVNQEDYRFAKHRLHAKKTCYIPGVGIDVPTYKQNPASSGEGGNTQQVTAGSGVRLRARYAIPQNAVLLLCVGELSRRKNHKAAIAALAKLGRKDVYCLICGQGAWENRLKRYAAKLGVLGQVKMPGFLEDIRQAYQAADIFILPSYQEGLSVALMEAMASGLPCVVSDIRGSRELVCDRGLRFQPGDSKKLAQIIKQLLEDKKQRQRYGASNQKKITSCDLAAVQKRMERIYYETEKSARHL